MVDFFYFGRLFFTFSLFNFIGEDWLPGQRSDKITETIWRWYCTGLSFLFAFLPSQAAQVFFHVIFAWLIRWEIGSITSEVTLKIVLFLGIVHGIHLSLRQLKRILRAPKLGRREHSNNVLVYETIERELEGSGCTFGYRQMTQRLRIEHGLNVGKETVRELLKILDPDRVQLRS